MADVQGSCDAKFEAVKETFERNFAERDEVGAAVAITVDGEMVVDLWAGSAVAGGTRPWQRDTLVNVWSTSKGMTAVCAHILAQRGELDIDAPVARYWPEFAQAGKENIPVRWLLSHRAGLIGPRQALKEDDIFDWDKVCAALAASEPWWDPGTKSGYHAVSFGFLVGEVVRRISGESLGTFLRKEVTEPLGADLYIGCPPSEHHRCADLTGGMLSADSVAEQSGEGPTEEQRAAFQQAMAANPIFAAFTNIPLPRDVNTAEWRSAEVPAANGQMTARGLATVYGALANGGTYNGVRIVEPKTVEQMREPQPETVDLLLGMMTGGAAWSWRLGFMPNILGASGPNPNSFGHGGAGGSYAFADPENRVSYAYVMNKMAGGTTGADLRSVSLVRSAYRSLGLAE